MVGKMGMHSVKQLEESLEFGREELLATEMATETVQHWEAVLAIH